MRTMLKEYRDFIKEQDIVTIGVGLVMALFFKDIVDAFVEGVVMPIVAAIFGKENFTDIGFDVGDARISIGLIIEAAIVFLAVALILYFIVRAYNKFVAKPEEAETTEVELLTEIRDELRRR